MAVLLTLLLPAIAQAQFDVPAFSVTPKSLQAGSHPDVTIHAEFSGSEHVRDLTISLPPGLAGDPTSKPRCAQSAFQADNCPAATRVGTTSVRTVIPPLAILPITASGDVYNVVPAAGEPARLGVVVRPPGASKVFIASPVRIRPADGGLDSVITNMPSTVSVAGLPVEMFIQAMDLTLSAPFASLPTACKPAQARVAAVSAAGTAVSRAADPFTPTGCDKVPFAPRLEATVDAAGCPACAPSSPCPAAMRRPRRPRSPSRAHGRQRGGAQRSLHARRAGRRAVPRARPRRLGRGAHAAADRAADRTGGVAALPGESLPGLRMDLSGAAALSLTASVEVSPIRADVRRHPRRPARALRADLRRRPQPARAPDLCRGPVPRLTADLTGHNGATAHLVEPIAVTGCDLPAVKLTLKRERLKLRVGALRGRPLQRVRLTLPRGMRLARGRSRAPTARTAPRARPDGDRAAGRGPPLRHHRHAEPPPAPRVRGRDARLDRPRSAAAREGAR